MKKIIIIPDSFKGSMSSVEVADILAKRVSKNTDFQPVQLPIADGGEGSCDCILAAVGGKKHTVVVKSPEWKDIEASFGMTNDKTAVVEIAESSGITKQTSFDAPAATTYGFGQLIKAALDEGAKRFLICLGGSATTDAGCGMAAALGAKFTKENGEEFIPTGGTLGEIASMDLSNLDERIGKATFTVMSDVENPLYGPLGAAYVYAPQKGATKEQVSMLDDGLVKLGNIICDYVNRNFENEQNNATYRIVNNIDYVNLKGAGAAGGAGCGCAFFLQASIVSGIEAMLSICHFDEQLKDCQWIVTGEGKLDRQSMMGKVLSGLRRHSGTIPIVSFCGKNDTDLEELASQNIHVVEIGRGKTLEDSMENGARYLAEEADKYFATFKS